MAQMDALALKAAEEVFGHGVVIGIALAGHAGLAGNMQPMRKADRHAGSA